MMLVNHQEAHQTQIHKMIKMSQDKRSKVKRDKEKEKKVKRWVDFRNMMA